MKKKISNLKKGKLRVGMSESTVLAAIAWAFQRKENGKFIKEKASEAEQAVKTAFCELPNFEILLKTLQEHGTTDLDQHISLHPGVPLKPMLAHPTKDMSEIFKRFGDGCKFAAEYKVKFDSALYFVGTRIIFVGNSFQLATKSYLFIIRAWTVQKRNLRFFSKLNRNTVR